MGYGTDISEKQYRTRLENALAMNEPLSKVYYLKEQLRQIWSQPMKAMAEEVLGDWLRQAEQSKIAQLQKMAVTMRTYKKDTLAWYDGQLSTGKIKGINYKIKAMRQNAQSLKSARYLTLSLHAI
ncbi:transposase [Prevotella histicola]|uniref:Transposase IS204/IS1001/IS1096/IS1165 DDE domain-containing protein n=1 Tax=Prevotella histicola F0411 TaxID=857291 RepID=G6AG56_9BACT|nr:transposase [Prevotella histicola]EHG16247.1 hypothetical protein HMPREF9138_01083 [Prevotella histicola F0411]QUB85094.1 transposase [Prevotella histicola]